MRKAPQPAWGESQGGDQDPRDAERVGESLLAVIEDLQVMAGRVRVPRKAAPFWINKSEVPGVGIVNISGILHGEDKTQLQLVLTEEQPPKLGRKKMQGTEITGVFDQDDKGEWQLSSGVLEPLTFSWRSDPRRRDHIDMIKFHLDSSGKLFPTQQSGDAISVQDYEQAAAVSRAMANGFRG